MADVEERVDRVEAELFELAGRWRSERDERRRRVRLDPDDFADLAEHGWLDLAVPVSHGGLFGGLPSVGRLARILHGLAGADPSVALVASMHPAVLTWWGFPEGPPPEHAAAWAEQLDEVFTTAREGVHWGTVTSEPGSGGDLMATRAVAEPTEVEGRYRLTGDKHFGSGSGVVGRMITTARVAGEELPDVYFIDAAGYPDGAVPGMSVTAPWDGVGMRATQSHGARLEAVEATRYAWPHGWAGFIGPLIASVGAMWAAIVSAVVDAAVEEALGRFRGREGRRPFETTELVRAELDRWLLEQAVAGAIAACEANDVAGAHRAGARAKLAGAELAESALSRVARATGGGSFSQRSPFAQWYEDVRALGYLRPPWALAFDQLASQLLDDDTTAAR